MYTTKESIEDMLLKHPLSEYTILSHGYVPNSSNYRVRLESDQGTLSFIFEQCIEVHSEEHDPEAEEEVSYEAVEDPLKENQDQSTGTANENDRPGKEADESDEDVSQEPTQADNEADTAEEEIMDNDEVDALFEDTTPEPAPPVEQSAAEAEPSPPTTGKEWVHPNIEFDPYWELLEFSERAYEWTLRLPLEMHEADIQTEWFGLRLIFHELTIKSEPGKNRRSHHQMKVKQAV